MATLIDDATATRYFNEIDNAPEDERQLMADSLIAWGNAKQEQEYNATDEHFSKLFTDESYFEQEKQANAAVQESLDPDQTAKSAAIGAWLEHRMGRPIDTMTYQAERDAYAMANYGKKNLDDAQFFDFVRGEYEWQKQRTEAINDLQMQAVAKAINDSQLGQNRPFIDGMTEVFNEWQAKYPELVDGQNDAAFLSQGYKLYNDTIRDLDTVRPQASKALSTLTAFTQGNATDEELQSLANDFVGAPPEDRQKIYKYVTLAAQAGQIDRAGLEQFAINMGQAFTRGFDFVPQGTLQMQEAGVNNWLESIRNGTQIWVPADGDLTKAVVGNAPAGAESDAWRQATLPETETLIQSGQNVRESFKVVRELRNVAKTGVDPIRPVLEEDTFWGTAERGAYGLAGSIPLMGATAVNPYLGVLAYQATEYDRIMLENPDIDPQFAQGLALVEGAANAAIDRVQLKSLSGKLPMFGRYLDRIKSDGIRRTIKIGANVFEQNVQEGAQDLIAPVLETAVAALREDMPDKDFSSLMDEWAGQRAETFFATLPLALIGGGIATYQDIKNPSAELNATKLRQVGFDKEQVTFIQRADNPEEYTARIQMEWDKRTPENIDAGRQEILTEMQKAATPGENDARISESIAEDGTRRWVVTAPDGRELLQTKDQQAALEAVRQHSEAQLLNKQFETAYEPEELRQVIRDRTNHWLSQNSVNTILEETQGLNAQQKLEQLQAAGNAAQIEELHNRIANSPFKDTPYDQINILGEASLQDVAEMVWRPLIKINPNTRPENLREEIHHIGVKIALKNNRVTLDTLRGWLDATEKALPGTFQNLVRETEGDIIESLAQVQAAYEDGKINANEETKLPASFVDYMKRMMRAFAEVLRRAVALRGAFKDGILPAEYEAFLAESTGLNQQTLLDTTRDRVSNEVLTDTNYSIGSIPFKEWFGDWENDPTTASKVVDSDGKPMVVYHGTTADMSEFTKEGSGEFGRGHYFAPRADSAAFFGGRGGESGLNIMPVYLSMKRPLRVDVAKGGRDKVRAMGQKKIRKQGYDGIIATGLTGEVQYVVFEPTQIKSATGNRGTFDPTSPNINYSIGVDPNDSLGYRTANGGSAITESQKIARDLGASSRAIQEAQPGTSSRDAELQAIRKSASIPWYDLGAFEAPATVASEHQIWFKEGKVFKATAYGRFGHSIDKGPGNASPLEYLRRIAATNEAFDDSARIVGKFEDKDGNLGLIHVQDFIAENPENPSQPTPKKIIQFLESRGFYKSDGRPTNYEVWINPDIGIEVTDLHPGNLIVDANGKLVPIDVIANKYDSTKGVSYSIASQSQIDRVNRALGGMNRGPDARIAVYERAKQKFSTLIQNNQQALDNLRAGTVSFRRTQLLQALGELDAILSIFPPDIRGRVGGYTRLASIAPHDVFKDGEKVSEVSGMNGAIISAWMREGLSIGPAGQQTELPPGYTAKENLGTARADRAIADFFKKRIEMIDRELEKTLRREYDEAFRKLLDRTKPKKAKPGEKPKGIGGDIQDLFSVVRDSVDMNATQVAAHIAGLDSMIASGDLTAEQEARAMVEAALVALTGDWKNADADRRRTAFMEASRIWNGAYAAHAQKIIRQREEREIARAEAIVATGKAGELAGRKSKAIADSGLKGSWKDYILNLLNFDQVVGVLFGENTEVANTIIDKQRRAENAKEDGSQAKMQELEDFFTGLAGGNVLDGERLRYRLTQPSMTVKGIEMSELEALSAVMMWVQEDGRRHMEGEMDEAGRPVGKWHYNQDFVDEILANLSEEALALRSWLTRNYANEYAKINEVYSELNGVNLPQIQLYSPVTVQPVNAPTGQVLDPVSGSAMSGASTSPGALRTRGTAIAEPRFQDVLQTYISHTLQMEHWKAFAPMIAEANGILRNRDVQNSVEEKGGAEARKMLNAWLDYFAQGGTRDAGAHLALNQGLNNVLGRASQVALVGRASTLLIQSTQLGAALAEMPLKAYLKRMGKLLTGQLGWDSALNSDYIQRRVKQMPPVVQLAMQGLKGAKPTAIQQAGKRLGMLLSGADGLFTAGTYAITYDYHLTKAKELGLAGQEAEDYARNTAERVTDRIAQPTRAGARSLYENTSTNPLARAGWAFASEARKNLALVAYSFAERDTATKMRTLAYVVALNAIGSAILRSIWRDILDDEDDELFDDKYWSPKRIAMAIATEPLYGFPVLGSVVQEAVNKSFGEYKPSGSLFSVQNAIGPIKRLPDHLSGDTDLREVMRDIDMVVSALGIMHPNIAATASITHLAKDLFNLTDSTVDAVTEN